ncbi:MAG: sigma-70 family RNA polymerase sigma factor [Phycisphaerales bacterium]|nr:MAG: sigma-70 family RNA polymerase sigma factor [Phycisphaerales bacterium]
MARESNQRDTVSSAQMERFRRLCWPLLPTLLRTARLLTRHEDDAEDLVQVTMLKALRALGSYHEGTNIRAWLMTIMRRTQIDRARAERRRGPTVSLETGLVEETEPANSTYAPAPAHGWEDPEALLDQFEDLQIIRALRDLPEAIRWTLLLVDVEGIDHQQAAEILGVPVGTIKSRAFRGRQALCNALSSPEVFAGLSVGDREADRAPSGDLLSPAEE